MIKKILLTGTMLAWFLMPQIANAPALRNSERASSLENQVELERTISKINAESEDKPWAKSKANARGLGQLTEGAWYDVEKENYLKNVFIPEKNIRATIKCLVYIDKLCRQYHPNWERLEDK